MKWLAPPLVFLLLAAWAAAMWFCWLGWDHELYLVDGEYHGPYRPWQVIGCALSIMAAAAAALWKFPTPLAGFPIALAATLGFLVPWSRDASSDDTGLWLAGAVMILVGGVIFGGTTLTVVAATVQSRLRSQRQD